MAGVLTGLAMRYQWASYMGCLSDGPEPTETFSLIGEGFTSFPEAKNPKEYTRKYINYQTEITDVIGYAPSIEYSCDRIIGDPVCDEIAKIHDTEAVGTTTHRNIVSVNLWEGGAKTTSFPAKMRKWAIIPNTKGDGTDALIYTGTMKALGDIIDGTFDTGTKKFTPTSPAGVPGA